MWELIRPGISRRLVASIALDVAADALARRQHGRDGVAVDQEIGVTAVEPARRQHAAAVNQLLHATVSTRFEPRRPRCAGSRLRRRRCGSRSRAGRRRAPDAPRPPAERRRACSVITAAGAGAQSGTDAGLIDQQHRGTRAVRVRQETFDRDRAAGQLASRPRCSAARRCRGDRTDRRSRAAAAWRSRGIGNAARPSSSACARITSRSSVSVRRAR